MSVRRSVRGACPRARRGGVYLLVLSCVLGATVMCVGGLALARSSQRAGADQRDAEEASLLATSALELACHLMASDPGWRGTYPSGVWLTGHAVGLGTIEIRVEDDDGDLDDDPADPVTVTGVGEVGRARRMVRVELEPGAQPIDALECAAASGGAATFLLASSVSSGGVLATNDNAHAVSASVNAPVEAAGIITGLTYTGARTNGASPRTIPASAAVVSAYATIGTRFDLSSVPGATIENTVIGAGVNPYGSADPRGIYIIDCKGAKATVRNCRVVGTLVFVNAGAGVEVSGGVSWDAAEIGMPALIADGDVALGLSAGTVSEASIGVNLNPGGLIAGDGIVIQTDSDLGDSYPSEVHGLVYAGDDLSVSGSLTLEGVLVAVDALTFGGASAITPCPDLQTDPPPGFQASAFVRVVEGSFRRHWE